MTRLKKILFIFICLFVFVGVVKAESEDVYNKKWNVSYGTLDERTIFFDVLGDNNSSLSVGYSCLSASPSIQMPDAQEAVQTECYGLLVMHDENGDELWFDKDEEISYYFGVTKVSDGYVILGYDNSDVFLVKYDFDGNKVWKKVIVEDYSIETEKIYLLHIDSYNDKIIVGFDLSIFLLDKDGNVKANYENKLLYPAVEINEDGIYVGGVNSNYETVIMKFNDNLEEEKASVVYTGSSEVFGLVSALERVNDELVFSLMYLDTSTNMFEYGIGLIDLSLENVKTKDIDTLIYDIAESRDEIVVVGERQDVCPGEAPLSRGIDVTDAQLISNCMTSIITKYDMEFNNKWTIDNPIASYRIDNVSGGVVTSFFETDEDGNYLGSVYRYEYPSFKIDTNSDGNGTVTSSKLDSESGELIEFTVEPKEGYTLKKVVVTTSTGEVLEFIDYKFTMPSDDVEIYAEFELISNPNTGINSPFVICGIISLIGFVGYKFLKKKRYI